jgi:hypothetical protein
MLPEIREHEVRPSRKTSMLLPGREFLPCCLSHLQLEVDVSGIANGAIQTHAVAREIKKLLAYENQVKEGFARTLYELN